MGKAIRALEAYEAAQEETRTARATFSKDRLDAAEAHMADKLTVLRMWDSLAEREHRDNRMLQILSSGTQSVSGPMFGHGWSDEELLRQIISASNGYKAAQEEATQARDAVPADRMVIRRAEKEEDKKLRLLQLWIWLAQQKEVAKRNQEVSSSAPRPHERPFGTTTRCSHHEHSLE